MTKTPPPRWSIAGSQLGPLERQLLAKVWSRGSTTVRELREDRDVPQAYTTIMTTLDRLFKKGLLNRVAEGRAFRYSACCAPEELPRLVAVTSMRRWIQSSSIPHLSYLVEAISAHDARLLDELRALIERKRQELQQQGKA